MILELLLEKIQKSGATCTITPTSAGLMFRFTKDGFYPPPFLISELDWSNMDGHTGMEVENEGSTTKD